MPVKSGVRGTTFLIFYRLTLSTGLEGGIDIRVVCTPPLVADLSDTR